jgi:hypothetical protein
MRTFIKDGWNVPAECQQCRYIKEQQQELIDLKYRYGRMIPGKEN